MMVGVGAADGARGQQEQTMWDGEGHGDWDEPWYITSATFRDRDSNCGAV